MPSPAGREGGRSRARPSRVPIIPVRTEAQRNPADKHGEAGPSASHSTPKRRAQPHSRVRPTGPAEPSRQAGLRGRAGEPSASHSQPRGRAQPQGETNRPSRAQPRNRARQGRAWRSGRDPRTQYPNRTSPQNRRVSDGRFDRSCREVRRSGVHTATQTQPCRLLLPSTLRRVFSMITLWHFFFCLCCAGLAGLHLARCVVIGGPWI